MTIAARRFPLEPVYRQLFLRWGEPVGAIENGGGFTHHVAARHLGVSVRQVLRWQKDGIPAPSADKCAQALGMHPLLLWPAWNDDLVAA